MGPALPPSLLPLSFSPSLSAPAQKALLRIFHPIHMVLHRIYTVKRRACMTKREEPTAISTGSGDTYSPCR